MRVLGKAFASAQTGGVALTVALALPPLLLISLGAIQLQAVFSDRAKAQDVADTAALWGAQQLTVTPVGAPDRTEAFAQNQLGAMTENATVTIEAAKIGPTTMKVTVDTWRPSFFFNLMPFGGFYTHAESTAEGVAQTPLCVITFGGQSADKMELTGGSQMLAPACLIHANQRIEVSGGALLQANTIATSTSASGPMNPSASTGAPAIDDPFSGLSIGDAGLVSCLLGVVNSLISVNSTLPAGAHCGDVVVKEGVTVTLAPGDHYFAKKFELKKNARLVGEDAVMIFGRDADLVLNDAESVSLSGRQSGPLAGFVIAATRNRENDLRLESNPITMLTGAIYVPNATLNIQGGKRAAEASDWTVMTAKALKLTGAPQIQINANYSGSEVPVPAGVGDRANKKMTRVTQ